MSLQVNLLKRSERRYQGIVSMKVLACGSAGVFAGITVLILLFAGISRMTLNANLKHVRTELERLTPPATELRAAQAAAAANDKMLLKFNRWSADSGSPMYRVLRSVQENIPSKMVLYHFSAGIEPADEKDRLAYTLYLSGTAEGEMVTIEAKRQLNADSRLKDFCGEVKLASSQRHSEDSWAFSFEGRRVSGGAGQ